MVVFWKLLVEQATKGMTRAGRPNLQQNVFSDFCMPFYNGPCELLSVCCLGLIHLH